MASPHTRILPRRHVTRELIDAVIHYPLTVLSAPAGYGKTLAVRAVVDELSPHSDWRIVLQSVSSPPLDCNQVWIRLADQLTAQDSEAGTRMRQMPFPPDSDAIQRLTRFAWQHLRHIDDIAKSNGIVSKTPHRSPIDLFASSMPPPIMHTLLVIDDWQHTASETMDCLIESVVREELPGLSILLLSRERPGPHLEKLCLKNLAVIFDQSLLAFSAAETTALFRLNGVRDETTAQNAWERSQGWPAAIHLHILGDLAKKRGTTPPPDVDALLAQTCFDPLADADKELLLHLCVLETFTLEQAARVVRDSQAPARLLDLYRRGMCIHRGTGGAYRLHTLLRSFLEKQLTLNEGKAFNIDPADALRQAGEMYLAEGDTVRAIRTFAKAGRTEDLKRILEIADISIDNYSLVLDPIGIAEHLIALPWSVRHANPIAYLAFIYDYIRWVDADKGGFLLDEAEKAFAKDPAIGPELASRIAGESILIRAFLHRGDAQRQINMFLQAKELLHGPSSVIRSHHTSFSGSPHAGLFHHCTPGTYEKTVRLCEQHLPDYLNLAHGRGAGADLLMRAELLLETGRFDEVNRVVLQADHEAKGGRRLDIRLGAAFVRSRLALITGSDENPLEPLTALLPEARASGHPLHQVSIDLAMGYMLTTMGKVRHVAPWLCQGDFDPSRLFSQGAGMAYIVHGKYLLAQGRYKQLADFCGLMIRQFTNIRSVFGLAHAHCQMASATLRLQGADGAVSHLMAAVELTRPDGLILPIACYGSFLLPVMERLYETAGRRDRVWPNTLATVAARIARRIAVYEETRGRPQTCSATAHNPIKELNAKSQKMLSLVAQGKSNAEVAHILDVKPVTVAKTLGIVYRSLNVRNRAEAIAVWSRCEEEKSDSE